jgi:hypothetical protein
MNFDQADVQSLKLRPTLIVGVGDFGGSALLQIRHKLEGLFGEGIELPVLALVWLDDQVGRREIPGGLSRLSLGLDNPTRLLRKLSGPTFRHIHRWWYPGWSSLGELAEDLGSSRPAGRVRFFYHYLRLRAFLQESLARLRDPENSTQLLNSAPLRERKLLAQVQFDQPTQVHVVGSGSDGSSGMLVDLGFLLRELVPDAAVTRTCWVSLAECEDIRVRANSYALLKELNHYTLERHGFTAEWEPGKTVRPLWPVFDACYLQSGTPEQTSELVADHLCKELMLADFGEQRRSLRLNVQTQAAHLSLELPEEIQQRLARGFSKVALARVRMAHGAIQQACAARLAARALTSLVGAASTPAQSPSGKVLELLGEERTIRRTWIARLLDSAQGPLVGQIQNWGRESWRALQRGHRSVSGHVSLVLQQGQRWLEQELVPQLGQQRQALLAVELKRLRDLCLESVEKGSWGLRQVLDKTPEVAATLRRWSEGFRRQAGALVELQRDLAGQIARQHAELARAESRGNWDGRRSLLIRHHVQVLLEMHLGSLDSPGLLLARLLQEAHNEAGHLCRELAQSMQTQEPVGELVAEMQILAQQLDTLVEQLEARVVRAAPDENFPLCYNLCSREILWEEIYPRYVEAELPAQLVRALLAEKGLGLTPCLSGDSFLLDLLGRCRRCFQSLPQDYALLPLLPRYQEQLPALLAQSELRLNTSRGESQVHVVGIPMLPSQLTPLQKAQGERAGERLQQQVQQCRAGLTHYFPMAYGEEIVFFSEAVALTVHELTSLRPLRDSYLHLYTQGEALHIECGDQQYSDLAVLGREELQAVGEAHEAFVLASLLGVLQQEGVDWMWMEWLPEGPRVHPLGERHRLIPKLSKAPRLRQRLLAESRRQLQAILEGNELQPLIRLATCLAAEKQRRWQGDEGASDLELLSQLEEKIQASRLYALHSQVFTNVVEAAVGL